jgi:hypothetical protein
MLHSPATTQVCFIESLANLHFALNRRFVPRSKPKVKQKKLLTSNPRLRVEGHMTAWMIHADYVAVKKAVSHGLRRAAPRNTLCGIND